MKKHIFGFVLFLCLSGLAQPPTISGILMQREPLDATMYFDTDAFSYHYYQKNNVFIKQKGKEVYQYKNVALGKITFADIQNPLKIVLFFEGFNTVVTLDNQLNETQVIPFSKNNASTLVTATGLASQNRLWVFNVLSMQLGLMDLKRGVPIYFSQPFQKNIRHYESNYNYFYWINTDNRLYYCDLFGKITDLGEVPEFSQIQILDTNKILYSFNNHLYFYSLNSKNKTEIEIEEKSFVKFKIRDQFLFIFTENEISKYQINLP